MNTIEDELFKIWNWCDNYMHYGTTKDCIYIQILAELVYFRGENK